MYCGSFCVADVHARGDIHQHGRLLRIPCIGGRCIGLRDSTTMRSQMDGAVLSDCTIDMPSTSSGSCFVIDGTTAISDATFDHCVLEQCKIPSISFPAPVDLVSCSQRITLSRKTFVAPRFVGPAFIPSHLADGSTFLTDSDRSALLNDKLSSSNMSLDFRSGSVAADRLILSNAQLVLSGPLMLSAAVRTLSITSSPTTITDTILTLDHISSDLPIHIGPISSADKRLSSDDPVVWPIIYYTEGFIPTEPCILIVQPTHHATDIRPHCPCIIIYTHG